jgi:hypothetical protein
MSTRSFRSIAVRTLKQVNLLVIGVSLGMLFSYGKAYHQNPELTPSQFLTQAANNLVELSLYPSEVRTLQAPAHITLSDLEAQRPTSPSHLIAQLGSHLNQHPTSPTIAFEEQQLVQQSRMWRNAFLSHFKPYTPLVLLDSYRLYPTLSPINQTSTGEVSASTTNKQPVCRVVVSSYQIDRIAKQMHYNDSIDALRLMILHHELAHCFDFPERTNPSAFVSVLHTQFMDDLKARSPITPSPEDKILWNNRFQALSENKTVSQTLYSNFMEGMADAFAVYAFTQYDPFQEGERMDATTSRTRAFFEKWRAWRASTTQDIDVTHQTLPVLNSLLSPDVNLYSLSLSTPEQIQTTIFSLGVRNALHVLAKASSMIDDNVHLIAWSHLFEDENFARMTSPTLRQNVRP